MIAMLSGIVAEKIGNLVVLDVGGVGYGLLVATEDFGSLVIGQSAKVYVYEHIREGVYDLYAFLQKDTKQLFQQLLNVSGVGPKMALSILSIGTVGEVKKAIATGNVKFIQRANGVGKRVAERIVVELKDKVGLAGVELSDIGLLTGESSTVDDEAAQALVALGFTPQDAARVLKDVDMSLSVEERVRNALKGNR